MRDLGSPYFLSVILKNVSATSFRGITLILLYPPKENYSYKTVPLADRDVHVENPIFAIISCTMVQ